MSAHKIASKSASQRARKQTVNMKFKQEGFGVICAAYRIMKSALPE